MMKPERDWLHVGAEFTGDENDGRRRVARQIEELTWRDVPRDGSPLSLPFSPGEGIKAAIEQLRLPRVQRVATDGYLPWPDGPETAHFSIYGIECLYADARVRLYLLDSGTGLTPLAADRWPRVNCKVCGDALELGDEADVCARCDAEIHAGREGDR